MFASLVALDGFYLLLSTQLTTDLTLDPCFIYCHICKQKSLFVVLKQLKTTLWIVDAFLFLIDCEQTRHLQLSCEMVITLPSDIFNSSVFSPNFNLRSAKTSLWSFFGVFRDNCRIWSTWAFSIILPVWPRLKSAKHLLTAVSDAAESEWHLSSHSFAWTRFFLSESNALSTHEIQILPLFWKFAIIASINNFNL